MCRCWICRMARWGWSGMCAPVRASWPIPAAGSGCVRANPSPSESPSLARFDASHRPSHRRCRPRAAGPAQQCWGAGGGLAPARWQRSRPHSHLRSGAHPRQCPAHLRGAGVPGLPVAGPGAIGRGHRPGGFTSTRLTVVLARTLAQQLQLPLDGVGSWLLIARRLGLTEAPAWLVQELPRRGLVAGLYGPAPALAFLGSSEASGAGWRAGTLLAPQAAMPMRRPCRPGSRRPVGVRWWWTWPPIWAALLANWPARPTRAGREAPWQPVLPLYATAPVAAD
jgi:hypothetical protein